MENYDLDNFEPAVKIIVIGVGGAGNNAVNRMIDEEIQNVEFWVANTDKQALSTSKAPNRIILGSDITGGLGAGGKPEVGEEAAEASANDIRDIVKGANMVFIAAGMGGGTGTGAAPVIAKIAKDSGALVVAIVTRPFTFEGKQRGIRSIDGLTRLRENVDSMIVVSNDKLLLTNGNNSLSNAFKAADNVLTQSVKTVVNLILLPAVINLDFADLRNTLENSGVSMIGFGQGTGSNRASDAANSAMSCPLLETSLRGARKAIIAVTVGPEVSLFDAQETVNLLTEAAGHDIDIKFGVSINDMLTDEILVSVIASDFETEYDFTRPTDMSSLMEQRPVENGTKEGFVPEAEPEAEQPKTEDDPLAGFLPEFMKGGR